MISSKKSVNTLVVLLIAVMAMAMNGGHDGTNGMVLAEESVEEKPKFALRGGVRKGT